MVILAVLVKGPVVLERDCFALLDNVDDDVVVVVDVCMGDGSGDTNGDHGEKTIEAVSACKSRRESAEGDSPGDL